MRLAAPLAVAHGPDSTEISPGVTRSDPKIDAKAAPPVEDALAAALPVAPMHPAARTVRVALRFLPLVLLIAAFFVLRRQFRHLSWAAVGRAMAGWGPGEIAGALALSGVSFLLMGAVEWLGLRWVGKRLPWRVAMAGSFLANSIAHAIGANLLVSGAVRARLYERYGVGLTQVAATTLFGGVSFAVGLGALGGGGLLLASPAALDATAIPVGLAKVAGGLMVLGSAAYVTLCAVRRRPLSAFGRSLALPSWREALGQLVIGVADNGVAAAIIWLLMPGAVSYPSFVGAYAVACVAGLLSSVPGGAGVFEGALSALLPTAAAAPLAAAFLGYRLAYYLLPLALGSLALLLDTVLRARRR
jgi:uncharacterized membrane protein YbhN (UPF0104 family)